MFKSVILCDVCPSEAPADPDEGVPVGWLMLVTITGHPGSWDDKAEKHFCSMGCVRAFGW